MSVLDDLLAHRLLFVTGKGGTGKSTVAAALAMAGAASGRRVLVVDVEARGDAARLLGAAPPGYRATEARPGIWHLQIHPEQALDEYLRLSLKLPRVYRIGPLRRVFDFIATAAPGVAEILITGKIGYEERAREDGRARWDLIVVDAAPSGQVLSHLRGPRTLQEMVQRGLVSNQAGWVREIVESPTKTGMVVVSLPEEMPVTETEELLRRAPDEVATPVLAIVANRVISPPRHLQALAAARRAVESAIGASLAPALQAAELLGALAQSQAPHLDRLRSLGPPVVVVPLVAGGEPGPELAAQVASALRRGS